MTDKLQVASVPQETAAASNVDQIALLKDMVAQIRRDCVENSEEYLDETTVPHGDE